MYRCRELLADATMAVSVDLSDQSDDTASRHAKLRRTSLEELQKIFDSYVGQKPTSIGHKFVVKMRSLNWWKNLLYGAGAVFFILGTLFQFASKRSEKPAEKTRQAIRKRKQSGKHTAT